MRVAMVGAGNIATGLSRALVKAGHEIPEVFSRTLQHAERLARELGARAVTDPPELGGDADAYVLAVGDGALAQVARRLPRAVRENKVVIHTSGSAPTDALGKIAAHHGAMYPLQAFSRGRETGFAGIPLLLEASDGTSRETVTALAESLDGDARWARPGERAWARLAAVFACNFVNHCYGISAELLARAGLPFGAVGPLMAETLGRALEMGPGAAQTGPARDGDMGTIEAHLGMLRADGPLRDVYRAMSTSIIAATGKEGR